LQIVQRHVDSLAFGEVQIVVHDHRVVQIERTEKLRLDKTESPINAPSRQSLLDH
jgi:hypothetical protein